MYGIGLLILQGVSWAVACFEQDAYIPTFDGSRSAGWKKVVRAEPKDSAQQRFMNDTRM